MYLIKDGETKNVIVKSYHRVYKQHFTYEATCTYKDIKDNPRLNLRIGDIVVFSKYVKTKYKQNQFAVILNRFKKIKECDFGTYVDYGIEFMMITGTKKGEIKKQFLAYDSPSKFMRG